MIDLYDLIILVRMRLHCAALSEMQTPICHFKGLDLQLGPFQRMRLKFKDDCVFAIRAPWLRNNLCEWNMQPKTHCSRPACRSAFLQTPLCILLLSFPCAL